eukprot:8848201-Lingulodinium_polyedra.AAC.1
MGPAEWWSRRSCAAAATLVRVRAWVLWTLWRRCHAGSAEAVAAQARLPQQLSRRGTPRAGPTPWAGTCATLGTLGTLGTLRWARWAR